MRGRDHHAAGGPQLGHHDRDRRRGDDPEIDDPSTRGDQPRRRRLVEQLAGRPRVPAETDDRRLARAGHMGAERRRIVRGDLGCHGRADDPPRAGDREHQGGIGGGHR